MRTARSLKREVKSSQAINNRCKVEVTQVEKITPRVIVCSGAHTAECVAQRQYRFHREKAGT